MRNLILVFIALLTLGSCRKETDKKIGSLSFDKAAYENNLSIWRSSQHANYKYSIEYYSEADGPQPKAIITVENYGIKEVAIQNEDGTITVLENNQIDYFHYKTIDGWYNYISYTEYNCIQNINSSENAMQSARIDVTYDETYHFPKQINCSGSYPIGYMGGLSVEVKITDFELIEN